MTRLWLQGKGEKREGGFAAFPLLPFDTKKYVILSETQWSEETGSDLSGRAHRK
jgi:hypothetical protein